MESGQIENTGSEQRTGGPDEEHSVGGAGANQRIRDTPAVGFIATDDDTDALLREVHRAIDAGHQVFVTHSNESERPVLTYAKQAGATIVTPPQDDPDREDLEQALVTVTRTRSFPGLVLNEAVDIPTDYERSTRRLAESDDYCLDGVPETSERADVLVAIPAYNEASTIADVVAKVQQHVDTVLVVDDGSSDDTAARARDAGAIVVEHESNGGYGAALKTIFREADKRKSESLVIIDADGQHDPADIPRLLETQQESGAELVIGSRFTSDGATNAPLYRRFGLFIVNLLTNLSFGVFRPQSWIADTQSGFRAYDRQAIESLAATDGIGDRMSASTDILHHAHTNGFVIDEVGTTIDYDVTQASSQHPLSHGLTLVSNILQTIEHERPITAIGVPGCLSLLIGLGFGYWSLTNYIISGTFPFGLVITSTFFGLAGIFACFTSIILHSLNSHPYLQD